MDLTQYCGIGFQSSNCDEIVGRKEEGLPSNITGLDTVMFQLNMDVYLIGMNTRYHVYNPLTEKRI